MTTEVMDFLVRIRQQIGRQRNVLEVGSLNVNGTAKSVFGDADSYTGIDMRPGLGVDHVMNAHDLKEAYPPGTFDLVICCETLEHDDRFWETIEGMRSVLKPGGWLIITTPGTAFPRHSFPGDYYRFFNEVYRDVFLKDFEAVVVEETPTEETPDKTIACFGVGRKRGR